MPDFPRAEPKQEKADEPLGWLQSLPKEIGRLEDAAKEAKRFLKTFDLDKPDERIEITHTHLSTSPFVEIQAKTWLHKWGIWGVNHNIEMIITNKGLPLKKFRESTGDMRDSLLYDVDFTIWVKEHLRGEFEGDVFDMDGSPCRVIKIGKDYIYLVYHLYPKKGAGTPK